MANIERIKKVVSVIESNTDPRLHFDMGDWCIEIPEDEEFAYDNRCGTAMCFAGWGAHVEGLKVVDGWKIYSDEDNFTSVEDWATNYFDLEGHRGIFFGSAETVEELKEEIEYELEMDIWKGEGNG